MKHPVGILDRRRASLRSTPAKSVSSDDDDGKRSEPKAGRIIEFVNAVQHARGM